MATAHGATFPIELVDLSHRGAGLRFAGSLEPGSEMELLLPGGELRRRAIVRWIDGTRGGLWFTMPLDRSDLESIARFRTQSTR
ncbi:PilZ domain-containing protein [Sphingopyxis sp. OAS728]|uniref:PilZ domain-containing protein n=1 Tax=Sphingopyxis sp. OAS728 TaxID=2663823 RepID=UPI001789C823